MNGMNGMNGLNHLSHLNRMGASMTYFFWRIANERYFSSTRAM
jgi:hypothetical protein